MSKIQIAPESQASRLRVLCKALEIADRRAREMEGLARAEENRAATVEAQLRSAEMRWASYQNDRITRRGQATRMQRSATEKIAALDAKIEQLSVMVDSTATPRQWAERQRELLDAELQAALARCDLDRAAAQLAHAQAAEDLHVLLLARLREEVQPAKEKALPARVAADEARARANDLAQEIERLQTEADAVERLMAERLALGQGIGPRAEA